jgi:hypothetical protein
MFLGSTVPVEIRADGTYQLTKPLIYQGDPEHGGDVITIPEGFVTDLASVPRFLSALTPIAGVHDRAAILHDHLCVQLATAWHTPNRTAQINAVDTDGLFLRCLRELGVPGFRRTLYWVGVRWGALFNPARRAGWGGTAPSVLGWSLLLLPILLPMAVTSGLTLAVGWLVAKVVNEVRPHQGSRAKRVKRAFAARRNPAKIGSVAP